MRLSHAHSVAAYLWLPSSRFGRSMSSYDFEAGRGDDAEFQVISVVAGSLAGAATRQIRSAGELKHDFMLLRSAAMKGPSSKRPGAP